MPAQYAYKINIIIIIIIIYKAPVEQFPTYHIFILFKLHIHQFERKKEVTGTDAE